MPDNLPAAGEVEAIVRQTAREEILPRFADVQHHVKHDGSIVTEADHATQHCLQSMFRRHWPQFAFLGEEMTSHEHDRLIASDTAFWCVDPLDGTSNFASGIPFFSVSVALLQHGRPVLGVVYDPVRDECFSARPGMGAWLNGARLGGAQVMDRPIRRAIACIDFKRLDRALAVRLVAEPPFGSQRNFGSSSLEWCWLADGRFHIYLHGGQKLWDYAAASLVLSEAGGHAMTLDGEPVFQAGLAPRSVIASLDSGLFRDWVAWLGVPDGQ